MLNPASPIPLYRQLAEHLRTQIDGGKYPNGAKLPSEHELCKQHRLGRPTVRQATDLLVQRKLVERRRGAGTFVAQRAPTVDMFSLSGTLASFKRGGVPLETELLAPVTLKAPASPLREDPVSGQRAAASSDAADALANASAIENPFRDEAAYYFERLGRVKDRPVLLECFYLSPGVFPALERHDLTERSISALVEDVYYLKPSGGRQSFRAELPSAAVNSALELNGLPVLLIRRTLDFPNAPGALYTELYCRTDELVFAQAIGGRS